MPVKDTLEFYARHIANWLTNGELVNRRNLSSLGIKALFSQIVTKTHIKRVICIYRFPVDYKSPLINEINSKIALEGASCEAFLNTYSIPTTIDVNKDEVFRRKMAKSEELYYGYKEIFESLSDTEKSIGRTERVGGVKVKISSQQLKKYKDSLDSYQYVVDRIQDNGVFFNTYTFLEIVARNKKELDRCMKEVHSYLNNEGFLFTELSANSSNFLSNFAPAAYMQDSINKEFTDILLSDENMSYVQSFISHGFIGDGKGTLLGLDKNANLPFILNFFESGARQITLIYAPSGHGKTYEAFLIILSMLANNVHCSYLDVKGDEGEKLLPYEPNAVILDFSNDSNTYVNVLRLDDLEPKSVKEAREFYNMSLKTMVNLLKIIYQPINKKDESDVEHIASIATTKLFKSLDVNPLRPASLKNTKDIKYEDIIPMIAEIKNSQANKQYETVIDSLRTKCTSKFIVQDTFKGREISLKDIINSPLVIYTLNKNKDSSDSLDDVIRTFMISYLDMKKISIRKSMHEYTSVFYEEIQRKEEFRDLMKHICAVVTGSRSSNVSVFLLCNTLSILDGDDMKPITNNLSTYIMGPIRTENEDYFDVLNNIGCGNLRSLLEIISKDENSHKHLFACKFDTGKHRGMTVVQCNLPKEISDSFATREVKQC